MVPSAAQEAPTTRKQALTGSRPAGTWIVAFSKPQKQCLVFKSPASMTFC